MHPAAMPLITSAQSVSMIEQCPGRSIYLDSRVDTKSAGVVSDDKHPPLAVPHHQPVEIVAASKPSQVMGRGVSPAWMILEFRYALAESDEVAGYHHNLMLSLSCSSSYPRWGSVHGPPLKSFSDSGGGGRRDGACQSEMNAQIAAPQRATNQKIESHRNTSSRFIVGVAADLAARGFPAVRSGYLSTCIRSCYCAPMIWF